ncbi:hypothetical protein CVS41_12615 [Aeromonas veronii]|nr:hypothetical protein CVS41_12615 [Aeromonas veronii]
MDGKKSKSWNFLIQIRTLDTAPFKADLELVIENGEKSSDWYKKGPYRGHLQHLIQDNGKAG